MIKSIRIFAVMGFSALLAGLVSAAEIKVPYPDNYRSWFHVKSMLIEPGHPLENPFRGIHHIYANKKAMKGYKTGDFPNGSVIVFDLLKYAEKNNTIQEGERKLVGVMRKNGKKYSDTGGWGFEGFAGDSKSERLTKDGGTSCFECHQSEKRTDYVFSKVRD
jgi:hypothetical protein